MPPAFPQQSVIVRAPAKLNLSLELLRRREDGYHEIDTVMVPINCFDTILIRRANHDGIRIDTKWWPNEQAWLSELGDPESRSLLDIPADSRNLIHRAITATSALANDPQRAPVGIPDGFEVRVRKRIPAGAGMGGASSDAAAAIRATAWLMGLSSQDPRLWQVAETIGSDVPFFLGDRNTQSGDRHRPPTVLAARAQGRGEIITPVCLGKALRFIVIFPATALSTPLVYRHAKIPAAPQPSDGLLEAMKNGAPELIGHEMQNRLSEPAVVLSALVADLLRLMWRSGLPHCQLTGSGSACFSLLGENDDITLLIKNVRRTLASADLKSHIIAARTTTVPQRLFFKETVY